MCSRCIDIEANPPQASVADELTFESWPERQQQVARAYLLGGGAGADTRWNEGYACGKGDQLDSDQLAYERAMACVDAAIEKLEKLRAERPAGDTVVDSILADLRALPEEL